MDTELDFLKTGSKEVVHKAGEFIGNKIVPPEKRDEILNKLRRAL